MAWNEPGNQGKDPWGNRGGKDQGPPDLDEVFRKFSNRFGGGGNFSGIGVVLVLVGALIVYGLSGLYKIEEAERGVVLRFGQFHSVVGPGLGLRPTFVDKVYPVNIQRVNRLNASGLMLTKDENVVTVQMEVQYRIEDPRKYLFNVTDPDQTLSEALDSALRYVVGHTTMDNILTVGREQVRQDTWEELDGIIAPYDMGIRVVDVAFKEARPPEEVKPAFDDAIAAREDEERYVQEATAYSRQVEPQARGQAERMLKEADAYRQRMVLEAEGEVARFNQLLPQYEAAPVVTRERLYLETMEQVYSNTSKVMVENDGGSMFYLPLDKIIQGQSPASVQPMQNAPSSQNRAIRSTTSEPINNRVSGRQGRN
ncbi:FtsH protease activity modulator HflK [Ferrimonas lipolytica]|uniref:Protein HflK n=1 Tax=Ferrimonas lipolytica TaxID=2724191 RepID=A0A6H1ULH8_9GAMM|nr:FtsH protease activity modulator HflK [Ferrimonas lipolytica]QIZ78652.1 FtsH protease activity modulator HflK [Ferrimonas lipolytica]